MALGKAKVIHCEIDARQNDGYNLVAGRVFPVAHLCVYKLIGNAFKANLAIVQHRSAVDTHVCIYLIGGIREFTNTAYKWLLTQIVNLFVGKGVATAIDCVCSSYLLVDNQKVAFHKTVFGSEHRSHIFIELPTQKYNQHAEEVGEKEACKLRNTNVLTQ